MTTETEQPVSTQGFYRYHDVIGLLSPAGPGFSGPVAVTTGPDGMLYVANRANPKQPDGVRVSRCTTDGDYLVSFRQTSTVGIVDRESGRFTWKWGPGEVSHQHNPSFLDNGRVLLFDNGSHRRAPNTNYSRIVEIDPAEGFTAARARNLGAAALAGSAPEFIQFVDGDCELVPGWLETAQARLRADADLFGLLMHRVDQRVRRGNGDFDLHVALRCTVDGACFGKHGARAVHFPVSDDVGPFGHV